MGDTAPSPSPDIQRSWRVLHPARREAAAGLTSVAGPGSAGGGISQAVPQWNLAIPSAALSTDEYF